MKTAGRNDPCPCGSGKKYKKYCLAADGRSRTAPTGGILESLAELKASVQELEDLSNSVVALIKAGKREEAEEAEEKPNVIIIYTDDQGSVDAHCYGSADLETPNNHFSPLSDPLNDALNRSVSKANSYSI